MIRYTFFALAILATAATAIASSQPKLFSAAGVPVNTTVVAKTSPFPVLGPIVVESCAKEDCSDI